MSSWPRIPKGVYEDRFLASPGDHARKRGPGECSDRISQGSGVALSREQHQGEAHWRRLRMPFEEQRHLGALARREDTVRQEHAKIGITRARPAARVRHLD